jgi:F420H2 dehydrogenase subunit N
MIESIFGQLAPMAPMLIMIIGVLLMPAIYFITKNRSAVAASALLLIVISMIVNGLMISEAYTGTYMNLFSYDAFSGLMILLFQAVVFIAVLLSVSSIETTYLHIGAYYSLLMVATTGMMFVATASDLITIFVGVELTSITSYVLVSMKRNDPRAAEAAVKYVIIGGLSSAMALFGISLLYGLAGTTDIAGIGAYLGTAGFSWGFAIAMITMIAGYCFKVAAVPFHMWAPDVYEGAATPVSLFLAAGSKKMGLVVLFKIFLVLFVVAQTSFASTEIQYVFAIVAAITMTVGNVVAISQTNIKRMLAYSSIAQAGYILIVLAVMNEYALAGGLFHMFTHVFMKGGAFVIVAALITAGLGENISDYKGLAKRAPFIAFAMMIFLFSLAGIPPLAGFTSKFVLFSAAIYDPATGGVMTQWIWLAFVAILNSAISLYYYTKVVRTMYLDKPADGAEKLKIHKTHIIAAAICLIFVIVLGVYPQLILDLCANAAAAFFI